MKYKALIYTLLSIPLLFGIIFFCCAYINDPAQLYHKSHNQIPVLLDNMREQAYGLIRHYEFDSIIIGSSMLENTSAQEASQLLGGKFMNISISGGIEYEKTEIINFAVKNKKIKRVLTSLETYFWENKKYESNYPQGLYTGDIRISSYLNERYFYCILLWKKTPECIGQEKNLDHPNYWADIPNIKEKFGHYMKWESIKDFVFPKDKNNYPPIETSQKRWSETYAAMVKNNPDIQFDFIVPPQSIFKFAILQHNNNQFLNYYLDMLTYLMTELKGAQNVSFYWFFDTRFPEDIRYYKDAEHYAPEVNSMMLQEISQHRHQLTLKNSRKKFRDLRLKIKKFELKPYLENLKKLPD